MVRALLFSTALVIAAPGLAAEAPRPAALEALRVCQAITADADRLACYDRAAAALSSSVEKKEVIVLDQQEVKKTKRSLFGFTLPKIGLFSDNDKDRETPEFTQIETTIKGVRGLGYGKFSFTIDDGAVWQTTEAGPMMPKPGDTVLIKKAALGSYFIKFGKQRAVKGMRVG